MMPMMMHRMRTRVRMGVQPPPPQPCLHRAHHPSPRADQPPEEAPPVLVHALGNVEVVAAPEEELALHGVDLRERDERDGGPGGVGVGVVIQKLIRHHQPRDRHPELGARLRGRAGVALAEAVDVVQREDDY
ncbi:hypothetical protein K438DRAFT_1880061 [Mycena galopus ATCC 62051]|nr:hypothetical protein K438DRAFT_1880061 [Mycena galopus ATCC 62051]